MIRKKLLINAAFIVLSISILLTLCGCPLHIDSLYGLKVAADGSGGALAIFEDALRGNIYAQKINPEGDLLWGEKGVRLGSGNSESYVFPDANIVSDDSGGAIVSWPDSSPQQFHPASHIARIGAQGGIRWQRDFVSFNQVLSDGSGGAIITFDDSVGVGAAENNLGVLKIDSLGSYPAGIQGVTVPRQGYVDHTLQFLSDGAGGVIVVWQEMEIQPNPPAGVGNQNTYRLFAQRINSDGKLLWGDGVLAHIASNGVWIDSLDAAADQNGAVVLSWLQVVNPLPGGAGNRSQTMDIVAQKIDAGGNLVWQLEGVSLEMTQAVLGLDSPALTSDGSGGAVIVWRDHRKRAADRNSLFAQRIDSNGDLKWQPGGVEISSTSLNPRAQIVSDGAGGVLAVYSFERDGRKLQIQKLDFAGKTVWPENGISLTVDGFVNHTVVSDGQGGAIVGWGMAKSLFKSEQAFIQRVGIDGRLMWGEKGINLNR